MPMKPQSCSASAMLEASPGKASFTASSSKAASKVVVEQQESPSAPASKMDGSDHKFRDVRNSEEDFPKLWRSYFSYHAAWSKYFALAFFPGSIDGVETKLPDLTCEEKSEGEGLEKA